MTIERRKAEALALDARARPSRRGPGRLRSSACSGCSPSRASPPTPPITRLASPRPNGARSALREIGFDARVEPTRGKPMVVGHWRAKDERRSAPARSVLRPLRRAAARPAGGMGRAALRPASRRGSASRHGDRRPRRLRRQGSGDDLHRGLPRLARGARVAARRCQRAARGRGGIGKPEPCALPRRAWR